jgi:RimJ/RimL family protein N-acetyltransferase
VQLSRRWAGQPRHSGFRVASCNGAQPGGCCPLLSGRSCPLVEEAAVIVHALPGRPGQSILGRLRLAGKPVLALTGAGAAPAAAGGDGAPASLTPDRLVEEVRRTYASRARGLSMSVRLRDGRRVRVQAIQPRNADLLQACDGELSESSRRFRYLGWMAPMSKEGASALASVDFRDRFALVALASDGQRQAIVGDCRLVPIPEQKGSWEIAIAIADRFQGAGLGRLLIERILRIGGDRGLVEVVAEVHYDNVRMMHLLRTLGFERSAWELGVVTFRASLPKQIAAPSLVD